MKRLFPKENSFFWYSLRGRYLSLLHNDHLNTASELLYRLSLGDKTAFQSIFEEYWQGLFLYAFNVLKDKGEAEDIVQEIFSQVWESRKVLKVNVSLRGYLYTATHYRVLRAISRTRNIVLDTDELEQRFKQDSTESVLAAKDLREQLQRVIDTLPAKCRQIYLLSREQHFSHKQIAEEMDISVKTVEAQLTIALRRIRQHLRQHALLNIFFLWF